jgi:hypothetical protein
MKVWKEGHRLRMFDNRVLKKIFSEIKGKSNMALEKIARGDNS